LFDQSLDKGIPLVILQGQGLAAVKDECELELRCLRRSQRDVVVEEGDTLGGGYEVPAARRGHKRYERHDGVIGFGVIPGRLPVG